MRRGVTAALGAALLVLAGCASAPGGAATTPTADGLGGALRIAAAASLQGAFDELAADFAAAHPGVRVDPIGYDGSSSLARQIVEGAPVDVFASADEANMATVTGAGLAADAPLFATNTLTIIVPAGNPGWVTGLSDLASPDLDVVLCASEVPCGAAAQRLLDAAGVTASVDSHEQNVTAVLTKVAAGEADAGLVYVTDAAASDQVETIPTAGADAVVNRYPIAALDDAANPAAAAAFVDFVRGEEGRRVLAQWGFGAP